MNDKIRKAEEEIKHIPSVYDYINMCSVYIVLSTKCNFSCDYCFEKQKIGKASELKLEDIKSFVEELQTKHSEVELVLYGGEPFLLENAEKIRDIISYAVENKIKVRAITNGSLVNIFPDKETLRNIDEFVITVDGPRNLHNVRRPFVTGEGSYDAVIKGICLLIKMNLNVTVRVNVDYQNENCVPDLLECLYKETRTKIRVVFYRIKDNCNYDVAKGKMSLYDFHKFFDRIQLMFADRFILKSGEPVYNQIVEAMSSRTIVYPRISYCGYSYVIYSNKMVCTCSEAIYNPNFEIETGMVNSYSLKKVFDLGAGCSTCEVNTICGGGCRLARKEKSKYCEKKDIISIINELYEKRMK
ncbi:MAG: 4Fe-4S cluster-binding domain-containing protein [Bacteroidales bacterium]|nr:4Fe-4S cluster-binding domain-containing protein [Bacteroidales bacterium]